jgi:hypothetical protein
MPFDMRLKSSNRGTRDWCCASSSIYCLIPTYRLNWWIGSVTLLVISLLLCFLFVTFNLTIINKHLVTALLEATCQFRLQFQCCRPFVMFGSELVNIAWTMILPRGSTFNISSSSLSIPKFLAHPVHSAQRASYCISAIKGGCRNDVRIQVRSKIWPTKCINISMVAGIVHESR